MHIVKTLLFLALVVLSPAQLLAQGIVCPEVDFTSEVGSRVVNLRWQDPPIDVRTRVDLSLKKIADFLPMDDSLAWRGTAIPSISGQFTGRCDYLYKFSGDTEVLRFTTVDSARVAPGWSGTALPLSGGTFPSCTAAPDFSFRIVTGGSVDSASGDPIQVAWQQDSLQSGTLNLPASYVPNTLVDLASGVRAGFTSGELVAGDSFDIRTVVPTAVSIRVSRFRLPNLAIADMVGVPDRVVVCRPDTAIQVDNGLFLTLSPGSAFNADFDGDSVGVFRVKAQVYDGFRVRRSDISNLNADSMVVLREYYLCRDTDAPFFEGSERVYRDVQVHNGFPYRYAVTCFDTLSHVESAIRRTESFYPRTSAGDDPGDIQVVPNPYKRRVAWEEGGEGKIQFINVPNGTRLRIYTASGSLVREIPPEDVSLGCGALSLAGCINWDLRNGQGEEIVSGIYIFQAESPGGKSALGKFMVAR
ncbi:MAG: hypothetical protein ACKVU1_02130 [bacterium]